ncbi:MAG: SoxR reducing system RseC family protein [Candidatus Mcinerneyibacterium aminivorans]|jgi:positive regulator of sigma E activity|uniref:SoxR reducing system RseC family protein n=1 Tax=Candidatus Mcinerneyibacterium aminivorans TaxID=2703815 RepID=A0A5D0MH33_9BACT|nr:MAG: SoxR reducing system RseC family protein [Candidatus Mcinerneyibacterium aminivorans]
MEIIGKIKKIKNNKYHIKTLPSEKCSDCNVCEAEQNIWLETKHYKKKYEIGDTVKIKYDKKFSYLIFLIYILPVMFLIIGAIVSSYLFDKEIYTVLSGLILMGAGIFIVRKIDFKYRRKFIPEIEEYEFEDKEVI